LIVALCNILGDGDARLTPVHEQPERAPVDGRLDGVIARLQRPQKIAA
jgi:hypothetical protein